MKRLRPQLIALAILVAFVGFSYSYVRYFVRARTHAVIVFIVPGASPELLSLAQNRHPNRYLPGLDQADSMAFVETQASDQITGNTAALASFLATGEIGPANQLSLRYDGKPADTLLYQAQRRGRAVGIISSGPITSAGTAAFFAHQADASVSATIANQLLDSTRIDLIFGGGMEVIETEKKVGHRDLLKEAEKLDYTLVFDRAGLQSFPAWNTRRIIGLFAPRDLPLSSAEEGGDIRLADLVERAIQTLAYNLLGYFLVIEHPLVANAAGQNQAELAVRQLHELDRAVDTARRYAGKNALILVYCPYSVGGFQFLDSPVTAKNKKSKIPSLSWHNGPGKTGSDLAGLRTGRAAASSAGFGWASAYGKGSDEVHGILNPGELHAILQRQL